MTNVPIRILNTSLELVSEVDAYQEAYFTRSLTGYGEFSITINANVSHASDFQKDYFVLFGKDARRIGVIEDIVKEVGESGRGSQKFVIKGYQAKGLFARRIIIPPAGLSYYIQDDVQETVIKNTVYDQIGAGAIAARQLSLLQIATDQGRGSQVQLQAFNTAMADHLTQAAEASAPYLGFELVVDTANKKLILDMIAGLDRRASQSVNGRVCFSSDYDTLKRGKITEQNSGYRNVVYVGGQGDGANKTIVKVAETVEATGLMRRETYVDASSLQTSAALENAGTAEINARAQAVRSIDIDVLAVSQYVYGVDYDLGDLVNIKEYDTVFDAQITEATEAWSYGNYTLSISFGKQAPTISSVVSEIGSDGAKANTSKSNLNWKDRAVAVTLTDADVALGLEDVLAEVLVLSGTLTGNRNLTLYTDSDGNGAKQYHVSMRCVGAFSVTVKASGAKAVSLDGNATSADSYECEIYCDGTDVYGGPPPAPVSDTRGDVLRSAMKFSPASLTIQTFNTAGAKTWTKPAGCKEILIIAGGGGGGGGDGDTDEGGGAGGAGAHAMLYREVADVTSLDFTVGAAGAGGGSTQSGSPGGATTIAGLTLNGGGGGARGGVGRGGGAGGTVSGSLGAGFVVVRSGDGGAGGAGAIGTNAGGGGGGGLYGRAGVAGTTNQPTGGGLGGASWDFDFFYLGGPADTPIISAVGGGRGGGYDGTTTNIALSGGGYSCGGGGGSRASNNGASGGVGAVIILEFY